MLEPSMRKTSAFAHAMLMLERARKMRKSTFGEECGETGSPLLVGALRERERLQTTLRVASCSGVIASSDRELGGAQREIDGAIHIAGSGGFDQVTGNLGDATMIAIVAE